MLVVKTCPTCTKEFTVAYKNRVQIYCSHVCWSETRQHPAEKPCANCGKPIGGDTRASHRLRRKYCSRDCMREGRKNGHTTTCTECGTSVWVTPAHLKLHTNVYCSRACQGIAKSRITGALHPSYKGGTTKIDFTCEICGTVFRVDPSRKHVHFCSKRCKGHYMSAHIFGASHPLYRGGKIKSRGRNWNFQRRLALERDNFCCQACHKKIGKHGFDYGVHHIHPYREFNGDYITANNLSNLITLCRRCHGRIEGGKVDCPQRLF